MQQEAITLVQTTWAQVKPISTQAAALFYQNLFAAAPNLQPLFKGDMVAQGAKLMQMIDTAVNKLDDLNKIVPTLQMLAKRHVGYGVQDAHYATVGAALLKTLEQGLGPAFTPEVKSAWAGVYGTMAEVMIAASHS